MRILLIVLLLFTGSFSFSGESDSTSNIALRDSIINYAQEYIGTPYVWAGTNPSGFDCTGFVYYVFKKFGIKVSRASSGYEHFGKEIELNNSFPGDIILFTGTNSAIRKIGHAGIILRNKNGIVDFIHSSSSKRHFGVTITRYNESGYVKRFLKVISVL